MVLLYHRLLFRKEDEEENKEEAGEDKGYALGALLPLDGCIFDIALFQIRATDNHGRLQFTSQSQ